MKKNKAIVVLLCILLVLIGVTYVDIFGVNPEGDGSISDISLAWIWQAASASLIRWWGRKSPALRI